jgi:hypothetical protein
MLAIPALALAGCIVTGPATLRGGRPVYNDAIVATNNEQVLAMIVRMRYLEPSGLLAVTSVTSNVRLGTEAAAQFGIGPESSFEGNLVPLGAAVAYEENPTITYTPVQDETYLREVLSPIPLDLAVPVLGAAGGSAGTFTLLVRSVNGLQNPDSQAYPSVAADARFARVADLLATLAHRGALVWGQPSEEEPSFSLLLRGEGETYAREVTDLFALLGLGPPPRLDDLLAVPVHLGLGSRGDGAIHLATRSVFDLFQIAAASVEVPEDHLESGLAPRLPPPGPAGESIHIRRSKRRPRTAIVAIPHRGWWYSIDATDSTSKQTFRILEALISVRIADTAARGSAAPVLTVPASR